MTWGAIGGAAVATVGGALLSRGSGGASQTGTSTTTQTPWADQIPYLDSLFKQAQAGYSQYQNNPASLFTAPQTGLQTGANQFVGGLLGNLSQNGTASAYNNGTNILNQVLSGSWSPSVNGNNVANLGAMASGSNPYLANLAQYGTGVSGNNVGGLASMANGGMLSNPYMQGMGNAAGTNIINQYQTATAPQISSEMEGAGRYGSGAQANAQHMAENALVTQLANAQNNLYGGMYQTNMGNMLGAGQSLNSAMTSAGQSNASNMTNAALGASGNTLQAALGLNNAMTSANTAQQADLINAYAQALGLVPNYMTASQGTAVNASNLGSQLQTLNQQQNIAPLTLLQAYQSLVGGTGYGNTQTQPIYTNRLSNAVGGGLLGLQLGGMFSGGGNPISNIGTAFQYGTTPFSQQTDMLAAQQAGM